MAATTTTTASTATETTAPAAAPLDSLGSATPSPAATPPAPPPPVATAVALPAPPPRVNDIVASLDGAPRPVLPAEAPRQREVRAGGVRAPGPHRIRPGHLRLVPPRPLHPVDEAPRLGPRSELEPARRAEDVVDSLVPAAVRPGHATDDPPVGEAVGLGGHGGILQLPLGEGGNPRFHFRRRWGGGVRHFYSPSQISSALHVILNG